MQEFTAVLNPDTNAVSENADFLLSEKAVGYVETVLTARVIYCTRLEVMYAAINALLAIAVLAFVGFLGSIAFQTPSGADAVQKIGSAALQTTVLTIAATICFRLLRVSIRTGNYWTCEKKTLKGIVTRIELYKHSGRPLEFATVESWLEPYDRMQPDIDLSETSFAVPSARQGPPGRASSRKQ